ncbi:hypothetical protein PPYR_11723 [Photinus pyralis]|uniref:LRRCT domain-containing protein n=2 Tax=Photinus pyralis TaxID=7054 RepID=A0A5N4AC42_PHOPY|nr:leucine-rich repeats and immunoglobulin-like domains protein 3 [Photinus pyralis]KAB0794884.1 hypothetical protein PPYR_11723 [Photinus pyralis]
MFKASSVVFVLYAYLSVVITQYCNQTTTGYYSTVLTCTNGTRYFPPVTESITHLKCLDCNISVLNRETIITKFEGEYFNLSDSHIQVIGEDVFMNFSSNMRAFILENNEISDIAPKVFNGFSILGQINLHNNNISQLPPGVFNGTYTVRLILSNNRIRNIDHMFEGLTVTAVNLSRNEIEEVHEDSFLRTSFRKGREFSDTQFIDLSNNLISKLNAGTFRCSNSDIEGCITILNLKGNLLTRIEDGTFLGSENLRILDLSDNMIAHLSSDSFRGLPNLNELLLRNNRLQKTATGIFGRLQYLDDLDLSQNWLSSLSVSTFTGLYTLETLNISHNALADFNSFHLYPLGQLRTLDISNITVSDLDITSMLKHHVGLKVFIINDNFWECKRLMQIYGEMSAKLAGFHRPSHHFDVPNLHGIACSHNKLDSYKDLSFNDFLSVISKEALNDEWFSSVSIEENTNRTDFLSNKYVSGIYGMMIFVVAVIALVMVFFIVKCVLKCLYENKILENRINLWYAREEESVTVCS